MLMNRIMISAMPSSLAPYYHIIFTTIAFLLSTTIFFFSHKSLSAKRTSLPPSPPGWPMVGNLFQFARSGKPFFQYADDLRHNYGPIFTLNFGTRTLIVVSSADLAHELLIEKSQIFASRPRENPTRNIFSENKFTVNSAVYGPAWRSLRRNMVQNMLTASRVKEFGKVRNEAMDKLIRRLKSEADANGGLVYVLRNARFAFFCILLAMCFGVEMDEKTIEKVDAMMKTILMILHPRIDDYLPILSPLFSKERKRALEVRQEQIQLLVPFIEKRRSILQTPRLDKNAASFSYLDTLFDLKVEGRKTLTPTNPEIVTLCSEFLNGGTDTTATAIEWAMARIIDNPDIQSKLYNEISSIVGDRKVDEKDLEKMLYLQAVMKEVLRKHPPTYLSLTHAATEPAKLGGYDIPTDANIEIYLPGISEDPKLWDNPEKFDPDRFFLGREVDDTSTGIRMLPFGTGRRVCPGLNMATMHVQLMVARLVQEFEWTSDPPNTKLDFATKSEFTVVMKDTLRAMIKPRKV